MAPMYPWYDVIQESTLEQGDMFFSLQVVEPVLSKTVTAGAEVEQAFSVPSSFLLQLANSSNPRLRLLPPYREHLAQAFARFIMRVGLPVDIPPFK